MVVVTDDYSLVYQGGHHNVYCNGVNHIQTFGGKCHPTIKRERLFGDYLYLCDCASWNKFGVLNEK